MTKQLGMRGAGRMLAVMAAMGVGLSDVGGYGRPRERYEDWCALWVRHDWESRVVAATRKRTRKAAKRRRDAELTRLGQELARATIERDSVWHSWCRGSAPKLNSAANARMNAARDSIDAIRRGEVTP
jgi:hypothetical protein